MFLNFIMSNSREVKRKLAAIMFTDIAGYTESMSYDESQAIKAVKKKRSIIQPLIKKYNGVFVKEIGDGTLSYFSSAIDASTCAIKLQELTYDEEHLNIRVGLHIGDIVFDGQDVFGEGVNIASRLESLSPVGGICVSKTVYDELENKKEFSGTSLGLQSLKGVGRLVEVYALKGDRLKEPDTSKYKETEVQKHSDDEVPSIAIIPFTNKGADEDVFYAYGISVDLISDVTSAGLIRVASKKQIEEVGKLSQVDLAKKLDVRYVSNGELWRMGEMFQLSIELYDTIEKKVVWSDRWQEKWDNLPSIKGNLSDGLLKALDTKPKVEQRGETINTEAYEFYLKAKHKYEKRETTDDTEITRGLLNKAIELDDNLILAKTLLGTTYREMGDYDEAMKFYAPALKQAEEFGDEYGMGIVLSNIGHVHYSKGEYDKQLEYYSRSLSIQEKHGDKFGMGSSLNNIGIVHTNRGDYGKALDYYTRSFAITEELGDKFGMGNSLGNIGIVHMNKGDYDRALDYYGKSNAIKEKLGDKRGVGNSLNNIGIAYMIKCDYDRALDYYCKSNAIKEELGDKPGMGYSLGNIGVAHTNRGDSDKALDYYSRSLTIQEERDDKFGIAIMLNHIGTVHANRGDSDKALKCLEKSLAIQKEIGLGANYLIQVTCFLYLTYKQLSIDYDINEIHSLIKENKNIQFEVNLALYHQFEVNLALYQLLEESSYLETAYNQVQKKVDSMDEKLKEKFLNYPIPKQILEEWSKINN